MDIILTAASEALTLVNILAVALGVTIGITLGAIPGLSSTMAIAISIPMTLTLSPLTAIGMLVGVMKGGGYGGAISATLLNTPGEPAAAATALDAHPLARSGKPRKALRMALFSSVAGDTTSDIALILLAAPMAIIASQIGQVEQTAILLMCFIFIAGLTGTSFMRGILAILLGVLASQIGRMEGSLAERFTFGSLQLADGLPLAAVAIGVLALPEVVMQIANGRERTTAGGVIEESGDPKTAGLSFREYWQVRRTLARGALIGTVTGALPGLGSSVASFLSYSLARRASKTPEQFGKGCPEGIAATESANSAVNGANLIPLLTLGIPGNIAAALLTGAFIVHGVDPGPSVFRDDAQLIYGLFVCMVVANVMTMLLGQVGLRFFTFVMRAPGDIIFPTVAVLCVSGVYVSSGAGIFAIWVMLAFGVLGWLMRRFDISIVGFVIGFVLGGPFESSLRAMVTILYRDPLGKLIEHPFAIALFALALTFIGVSIRRSIRQKP